MRCAIYLRVSTSDGRQDTTNQLMQLQEFCKREQWTVVKVYEDNKSGKSSDRTAYQKMLADAEKRRFDVLLFWALDRLSREGVMPTLHVLTSLSEWGIKYRSYSEQYLDSCGLFRDAVVSILATIAKQERIRLSERTKAGLERQKITLKPGPKGYLTGGRPQSRFDRAQALRMFASGETYQAIADACGTSKGTVIRFIQKEGAAR